MADVQEVEILKRKLQAAVEKARKAEQESREAKSEAREAKLEAREAKSELIHAKLTSLSDAALFVEFKKGAICASENEYSLLGFRALTDQDLVILNICWSEVKELVISGDGTDEIKHVHPFIMKMLDIIFSKVPRMKDLIRYHAEATVSYPVFRFDLALTSQAVTEPTYESTVGVIEIKAAFVQTSSLKKLKLEKRTSEASTKSELRPVNLNLAKGQVVSYISAICAQLHNKNLTPDDRFRVGIATNGHTIAFVSYLSVT